mmetsp:Transcript_33927/g.44756  ORF Transcript_33927/g.44756 Transcript_33927/m.44756 type:complete len:185 (+) Transcript_33927:48-602(+)
MRSSILKFLCLIFLIIDVSSTIHQLEAEDFKDEGELRSRSAASNQKTVWLHEEESIQFGFEVLSKCNISLTNVVYSNDGSSDIIEFSVNGITRGEFQTAGQSNGGYDWNVMRESGTIFNSVSVSAGQNILTLNILSADSYGVEVDYILIDDPNDFLEIDAGGKVTCCYILSAFLVLVCSIINSK